MTEKEKAKAYDEAIERAKESYGNKITEEIFPELKEDDAERIKKNCIHFLELQKQHHAATFEIEECIAWIENQSKKYTDKNNPKFNVGDWVVDNCGYVWKIEGILNQFYLLEGVDGDESRPTIDWVDKTFNLWTIQDANDGDILSFYTEYKGNKMVQIGIIEKYVSKHGGCSNTFKIHVGMNWNNNLQIGKYMGCSDIHPATKEQRDALMKAINDAEYEWDTEKKN